LIKAKQIQGLENLESLALISASQTADGTVTLTRGDGVKLSFTTGSGTDGTIGDKGPKGYTGPDGYGAYELAVNNGYSGTEAQWRASLKGNTGDNGSPGANGQQGAAGITPTFQTSVSVTNKGVGGTPTVTRNTVTDNSTTKTYSLSLGIPQGKAGSNTSNGTSYTISTTGSISKSSTNAASAAAASISWSGTTGTINVTLPTGNTGSAGSGGGSATGKTPTLSSVSKGTDLSAGSTSWTCSRSGTYDGGAVSYTIALSKAATGNTGSKGPTGPSGQSSTTYLTSKWYTNENEVANRTSSDNKGYVWMMHHDDLWAAGMQWKKNSLHQSFIFWAVDMLPLCNNSGSSCNFGTVCAFYWDGSWYAIGPNSNAVGSLQEMMSRNHTTWYR
jgi:hypothetical protein